MGDWQRQAMIGIVGGGMVFVAVFLPLLVVQFRRYGRISVARLIGAGAVSVYAVALLAYTFVPLPDSRAACASGGIPAQLWPFAFVGDIAEDVHKHGMSALLAGRATLQVVFNVLLFIPLGIIVRRFWSFGVLASTGIGFLSSLLIEATQYTGIWGLYPCAYRIADVDDLLANTTGALVGALIGPLVLWWMPQARELRSRRLDARPVSAWRRWFGMLIDLAVFGAASTILTMGIGAYRLLSGLDPWTTAGESVAVALVAGTVVFLLPAVVGSGASIGQRLVWLRPALSAVDGPSPTPPTSTRPPLARRLVRSTTGAAYTASVVLGAVATDPAWSLVAATGSAIATLLVAASVLSVPLTRGRRGIAGVLSGTEMVDSRSASRRAPAVPSGASVP